MKCGSAVTISAKLCSGVVTSIFESTTMDERAEIPEKPDAVELAAPANEIEFRHVYFGYANEGRAVLQDVSLTVPVGKMAALVGESGGGKSTLTKLLPRFHDPTSGAVLWDGADLRDARIDSVRRHIALVTQETVLFNDTVFYNITYGRPEASDEDVRAAARTAFAHDLHRDECHVRSATGGCGTGRAHDPRNR